MKVAKLLATASVITLLAAPAMGATSTSIKDSPEGTSVTLSGTVEDFDSQHTFILHDSQGTTKIDLSSIKPLVLTNGEKVSVTGTVHNTILGTDIVAQNVNEDKGFGEKVGSAIDSATGQDAAGQAQAVTIQSLPKSGFVKVSGVVDSVSSGKKFTLRDSTGNVEVNIVSGESASLAQGTPVLVVGNVDSGLLGKSIKATDVEVRR